MQLVVSRVYRDGNNETWHVKGQAQVAGTVWARDANGMKGTRHYWQQDGSYYGGEVAAPKAWDLVAEVP